jgi:hypothetical protein
MDGMGLRMRSAASIIAGVSAVIALGMPVTAAVPANDDRGAATVVNGLPFHDVIDTSEATPQAGDPDCASGPGNPTVWYSFTPAANGRLVATTKGSDYDTTLLVATPDGSGGLDVIACDDDSSGVSSTVIWQGTAGQEYLLMAGACCGNGGGVLVIDLRRPPPPPTVYVTIASRASLTRYGGAIVHGHVRCYRSGGHANIQVRGRQDYGRIIVRGYGSRHVACGQPWRVTVRNYEYRFGVGPMQVKVSATACGATSCSEKTKRTTVRIS